MMADTIIFLMNGWDSTAGGIQTVNRELAAAVAKLRRDLRCVAVVVTATDSEVRDAYERGVELVFGDGATGWTSALMSPDLQPKPENRVIAVIGHSTFSGREAKILRDRHFPEAQLVQFVHTSPLHLEAQKEAKKSTYITEREAKLATEIALASEANLVICIGPRLYRAMHDRLAPMNKSALKIRQIKCGIWRDPAPVIARPIQPTILSMGRTESLGAKGLDIFAYMAGHLQRLWMGHPTTRNSPQPQFIVRGSKDNGEDFERVLTAMALEVGPKPTILARPYTSHRVELEREYRGASIFVMPSREEGFGLVACEALSLGTPTLVSAESGIAEVLREVARDNHLEISHCVIPIDGNPKTAGERFAEAALEVLTDYDRMRGYFDLMAEHMLAVSSWDVGARQLLDHLGVGLAPLRNDEAPDDREQRARNTAASIAERHRASLVKHSNVISVGIEEVIVVRIANGAPPPNIPSQIEGVTVVVREGDPIRLAASQDGLSGDLLIGNQRRASATILRIGARTVALTARHAVANAGNQPIYLRIDGEIHSAKVALMGTHMDLAVLELSTPPLLGSFPETQPVTSAEDVFLRFSDRTHFGQISAFAVSTLVDVGASEPVMYNDLLEVRLDPEELRLDPISYGGMSGALVASASTGAAIGMVVAHARGHPNERLLYCYPIQAVLNEIGWTQSEPQTAGHIAILVTDPLTFSLAIDRLAQVRRTSVGKQTFFSGIFHGHDIESNRLVTICNATAVGNINSAISTIELIRFVSPTHVLVVGLGGGIDSRKLTLGDVVIASDIIYYEAGKIGGEALRPRIQIVGKTVGLSLAAAQRVASSTDHGSEKLFNIHIGTIASGEKVVHSADALREMMGWSSPLAVDMESAGAAQAAASVEPEVPLITVRGIADLADSKQVHDSASRTEVRKTAAENAVSTAFALISSL